MRKKISYFSDLPLTISLEKITDCPIYWNNSTEIIFVLKGSINILVESDEYVIRENEIEIINADEAHKLSSDEDNLVLVFEFDNSFFEKYYHDMANIYFSTTTGDEYNRDDEKFVILKEYLSILVCETYQKGENYDEVIEDYIVKILFHLINNFHYLTYNEDDSISDVQFSRYHRISKYIYNNYKNTILLSDIASKEFISAYYLSHEIKNMTGMSFQEFLNMIRSHESVKLLLDSNKTISEISYEIGFSHPRYYNKHFRLHFGMTPLQFRKKYYIPADKYEEFTLIEEVNLEDSLELLVPYIDNYPRFNYQHKIVKLSVNANKDGEALDSSWAEIINLGDALELSKSIEQKFVATLAKNISFKYGLIEYLFHKDMKIYFNENIDFLNWNEVEKLIEFMLNINLIPMIVIDKIFENQESFRKLFKSFILYFLDIYDYHVVASWKFRPSSNLPEEYIELVKTLLSDYNLEPLMTEDFTYKDVNNPLFDYAFMAPYTIHNFVSNRPLYYLKAFDTIEPTTRLNNELFFGSPGIMTINGIRKPSYYALYLLSKLGDTLIDKGEGYIVTKSDDDYQVLVYSYDDDLDNLKLNKSIIDKEISLYISNLKYDYTITKYEIGEAHGSAYNHWASLGRPRRLSDDDLDILYRISSPTITLENAKKSQLFNTVIKLHGYSATLITLQKVQKHLF